MFHRRRFSCSGAFAPNVSANAQTLKSGTLSLVVPFAAGGPERRRRPHPGAGPDGRARADRRRGKSGRRRRHGRLAARVARHAGRLGIRARQQRHAQLEPVALQEPALRHDQGLHAARPRGRIAARHHRAEGSAGQHAAGVHRLREGEPGQDPVRLGGRRLRLACELHPAQRHARRERHPRALSRPRPGDAGPDRRPRAIHLRLGLDLEAADRRRPGQGRSPPPA